MYFRSIFHGVSTDYSTRFQRNWKRILDRVSRLAYQRNGCRIAVGIGGMDVSIIATIELLKWHFGRLELDLTVSIRWSVSNLWPSRRVDRPVFMLSHGMDVETRFRLLSRPSLLVIWFSAAAFSNEFLIQFLVDHFWNVRVQLNFSANALPNFSKNF